MKFLKIAWKVFEDRILELAYALVALNGQYSQQGRLISGNSHIRHRHHEVLAYFQLLVSGELQTFTQ